MPCKRKSGTVGAALSKRQREHKDVEEITVYDANVNEGTSALNPTKSFLDLPRELRDVIYHEVWTGHKPFEMALPLKSDRHTDEAAQFNRSKMCLQGNGFSPEYYVFIISYDAEEFLVNSNDPRSDPCRLWLLANKQICVLAVQQFQRKALWLYCGTVYGGHEHRHMVSWKAPVSLRGTSRFDPLLLSPNGSHHIHLGDAIHMLSCVEMDSRERPLCRVNFLPTKGLLQRLAASFTSSSALRTLMFSMELRDSEPELGTFDLNTPVAIDFQPLLNLKAPNLHCLTVEVNYSRALRPGEGTRGQFLEALSKTGLMMIGGRGVERNNVVDGTEGATRSMHRFTRVERD